MSDSAAALDPEHPRSVERLCATTLRACGDADWTRRPAVSNGVVVSLWEALLWCNGRQALPGRARLGADWTWWCAPLAEWDGSDPTESAARY